MRLYFFLLAFLSVLCTNVTAQTDQQNSGWLFLLNNTKISEKWGAYMDIQVRSADKYDHVRNLLFRPGITYYASDKHEITLGYLLNETFIRLPETPDYSLTEHRIWEQYVFKHKIKAISASHRFRLEQRFIERNNTDDLFAQRFRYFFRFLIPVEKGVIKFEKGLFLAIQNEIFLNIQHKDQLNGQLFDQNRAYAAAGYRFSKKLDIEAGYMNQSSKGINYNTANNIIQLAVYTKF